MKSSQINILLISTSYPVDKKDWKGLFIKDMVYALADNCDISLQVWSPPGNLHKNAKDATTKNEKKWLRKLMLKGGIAHLLRIKTSETISFTLKLLFYLRKVYLRYQVVDIIHVNWLQNIIPLPISNQPLLVTVLGSDMRLLKLPGMETLLRRTFKNKPTIIAPNAEWMVEVLQYKFGDIAEVRSIPFGIHSSWYQTIRQINKDKNIWLIVSRITKNKLGPIFSWGTNIFLDNNELHLFGPNQEKLNIPPWIHYHGSTNPQELQDKWFAKATGLISLSQHDEGRPQVMLEAMAAGLPILASAITAHTNFIQHGKTGYIVNSQTEFKEGILWLTNRKNNNKVSKLAKEWASTQIGTWEDCASQYINAYKDLLSKKP